MKQKITLKKIIIAGLLLFFLFPQSRANHTQDKHITVGDTVPTFTLNDQYNHPFNIKDSIGKHMIVIYFYPKDESAVCTKEACSFRDSYNDFTAAGAIVIGINSGSVESHKKFTDHYKLPFILLSDPDNKVLKQFGVKSQFFVTGRETFVIDLHGKIVYTYNSMIEGKKHASQALEYVKNNKL
ncbi:peroxiredoxin [Chitinophagaceae bacterium LWZ2-11]